MQEWMSGCCIKSIFKVRLSRDQDTRAFLAWRTKAKLLFLLLLCSFWTASLQRTAVPLSLTLPRTLPQPMQLPMNER